MTTTHDPFDFVAGDDWQIRVQCVDENEVPFDLTGGPALNWTLVDYQFIRAIESNEVSIAMVDAPNGKIAITVPASVTTRLAAGLYSDALRIVVGGIASTLLFGPVYLTADPWREAVTPAQAKPPPKDHWQKKFLNVVGQ